MLTVFVNLSNSFKISEHEPLFSSLVNRDKFIGIDSSVNDLLACAKEISDVIFRNSSVSPYYNLIIYLESNDHSSLAFAKERLEALKLDYELIRNLKRVPRKSVIIFGEYYNRENIVGDAGVFHQEYISGLRKLLVEDYAMPGDEQLTSIISDISKCSDSPEDFVQGFVQRIANSKTPEYLQYVYDMVAQTLRDQILNNNAGIDINENIFRAVNTVNVNLASTEYAYICLSAEDYNENQKRSIYRLLLFVYKCASFGDVDFGNGNSNRSELLGDSSMIPHINWEELASDMKICHKVLKMERDIIGSSSFEVFSKWNEESVNKGIPLKPVPKLKAIDIGGNRYHFSPNVMRAKTEEALKSIKSLCEDNKLLVNIWFEEIINDFNTRKEKRLPIEYKYDVGPNFNKDKIVTGPNAYLDQMSKNLDMVYSRILAQKTMGIEELSVENYIREAEVEIEHYLKCIEYEPLVYLFGAVFMVLASLTYGIVQEDVFSKPHGLLIYVITLLLFAIIFLGSVWLVDYFYKQKIVRVVRRLRNAVSSKQNRIVMNNFLGLLQKELPYCFCLAKYRDELIDYIEREKEFRIHKTYHLGHLKKYDEYLEARLRELFLDRSGEDSGPNGEYTSQITINRNVYSNSKVYRVVGDRERIREYFT